MNNDRLKNTLVQTLNKELSGLRTSPLQRETMLQNALGGYRMKRKLTTGWVIALALLLFTATAFALVSHGLTWYYNNRLTAYREYESEKHAAIMENLMTDVPQTPVEDPEILVSVTETSWLPQQHILVVSIAASPKNPDAVELHPKWNLDADGSYVGKENLALYADDEEARGEHWLWTAKGFGPIDQMVAPGKQLLLFEADSVYFGAVELTGDMSSMDSYLAEDGTVCTVLEIHLEDYFDPSYADSVQQQIESDPGTGSYLLQRLRQVEYFRQALEEDEDGVITLTIPYTVTPYSENDEELYMGGRSGEMQFELKIR